MSNGTLIIAGGQLESSSARIFGAYIKAAGGTQKQFALLPAASGNPEEAFVKHTRTLVHLGVPEANIVMLEVSLAKAEWKDGARDPAQLQKASLADGFWIYGGDQNAVVSALREPDGADSPLLALMREKLANGAVIGGSSAGAAVMSDIMIGGGTSFGAMAGLRAKSASGEEISDALLSAKGFGFFTAGIIDQHFNTRARLARLAEAAIEDGNAGRPAFGIAEDTAMVVDLHREIFEVVGSAGVYIVNLDSDARKHRGGQVQIENLILSYLNDGDRYFLDSGIFSFSGRQEILPGSEYYRVEKPIASGVLSGYGTLAEFIANFVVDNDPACLFEDKAKNLSYAKSFLMGTGLEDTSKTLCWEIRLGRRPGFTRGWVGTKTSFENIIVDIIPVSITISSVS